MASRRGKEEEVIDYLSLGSKITAEGDCSHEIKRRLLLGRKTMTNLAQRHHCADKDPYSQSYDFSSSHVWMWEFDHKEVWAPKNWCFWTVVLEKTLGSPLDSKAFPGDSDNKESACNSGYLHLIPGQGAKILHAVGPKNQSMKGTKYGNKLNKYF